ncbi:hypothetical protein IU422_24960 [Nocardia farcinica]|nr:hypothetical protein [Nocardia farcinica]
MSASCKQVPGGRKLITVRHLARSAAALAVLAAALGIAPAAQATASEVASATRASIDACIDHAVANGANEHLATYACHEVNLTDCYRIFRDNYGSQQWALDACKRRTV